MSDTTSILASGAAAKVGLALRALVTLILVADGTVDLAAPHLLDAEMAATGFPPAMIRPLGIVILVCAILYTIPWTSVLGAVLVTGFLGGAICTHFRLSEIGTPPQIICLVIGVLTWAGLWLSDHRVRALLPLAR